MNTKRLILLAILLLSLSACAKAPWAQKPEVLPEPQHTSATVPAAGQPEAALLADGVVRTVHPAAPLAFKIGGPLAELHVEEGQAVRKGDLLAVLDDVELLQAVERAKLDLQRALEDQEKGEGDLERAYRRQFNDAERAYDRAAQNAERAYEIELEAARRALERAKSALEGQELQASTTAVAEAEAALAEAVAHETELSDAYQQALDRPWETQKSREALHNEWQASVVEHELAELRVQDARLAVAVHKNAVAALKREVEYARADLQRVQRTRVDRQIVDEQVDLSLARAVEDAQARLAEAQEALEKARLYAPWDARVLSLGTRVGAAVAPGAPVLTLLDTTAIEFHTTNLSERDLALVSPGQTARVTLKTYPDEQIEATVVRIGLQAGPTIEDAASFPVVLALDETDLEVRPGMTGQVEIQPQE